MTDKMPAQIGRFRIVEELGRGAMGVVYKALDPALDRAVAIKTILLSGDASERAKYEARFLQEAKAAGRLSHPAIITIHDVGREGDLAYMAMELLNGVELRVRMAKSRLSPAEAIGIVVQVAEGLALAHEHGVVHRDIKPANIMLLGNGRIKIMDFGIARLELSDVKTQTGMLLGTPKYMSPEQVAGRSVDHRSDIFSLGAVLYEMLIGRVPFSGTDTTHLLHSIATATHITPSRIVSELPALLDLIMARALEKDPAVRYQSAREFAADLQACLDQMAKTPPSLSATLAEANRKKALLPEDPTEKIQPLTADDPTSVVPERTAAFGTTTLVVSLWPLSRRFDSSMALHRLEQAAGDGQRSSALSPRPPGGLTRLLRDRDLRQLAIAIAASLVVGAAMVLM